MKITTTKSELKSGIALTGDIAKPGLLPILSNILMRNSAKALTFTASDVDMQVSSTSASDNADDFAITIPAAKFTKIISSLPDDAKITLDIDGEKLTVKSGRSKFGLQTLPAADFPMMEHGALVSQIDISQEELKHILQRTMHAQGIANTRQVLNGTVLEVRDGQVTAVASDGMRLAAESLVCDAENMDAIIPRAAVAKLVKLLSDGPMSIEFYEGKAKFLIGEVEFITKLIEGKFPDYRRIIPNPPNSVEVNRKALIECINRASVVLDKARSSKVTIGGMMSVTCSNAGETASDEFEVGYSGNVEIGMNPDFLRDAANALDGEFVTFKFSDAKGAILMSDVSGLKFVVMPLRN